jgi:hypothetical protein
MIGKLLAAGAAAIALSAPIPVANSAQVHNVRNCDTTLHGTYKNVTVQAGSTCVIAADATVTGGVHAKQGAANLFVRANVGRNIQAKGVTGTVIIGPPGCRFDPLVGNNVHVFDSHNVLVCQVSAKDNIMVNHDDGEITIRDSRAGHNIAVNRELAFSGSPFDNHRHPDWLRVFRNHAGNHIFVTGDRARVIKLSCCGQPDLNRPLPILRND